ncbi:PhnA protein [Sulfurimonas lithotrophica]|uniref:PhnA protein n=1 Tax=Sulfurimonas lithotrophica TaxID=2590022 RepID=A0A5P8P3U7_9BACT|nr:alkylphosphonate utilization protein [Sulfurimonas lithotrophica]QFR50364.1 PhnA protein [Sulfurimonas lithotrophica]
MNNKCDLCGSQEGLVEYVIEPSDKSVTLCSICNSQVASSELDENHFNCLNDSMWSEDSAVKVLSYILLNKLGRQDMIDMMYLEEDEQKLADQAISAEENKLVYKDCNGVELKAGDSIVIMKDLDVKGAGFTAKRGTTVTRIALAPNDETHVEGRVNGTKIFLKTEFIKKA